MCDVLGYERYGAAGGDWGAIVTGDLAHSQPERLAGAWLILPSIPGVNLRTIPPGAHAEDEQWMLAQMEARQIDDDNSLARTDAGTADARLCTRRFSGGDGSLDLVATPRLKRLRR
jgi:hypothetical protein